MSDHPKFLFEHIATVENKTTYRIVSGAPDKDVRFGYHEHVIDHFLKDENNTPESILERVKGGSCQGVTCPDYPQDVVTRCHHCAFRRTDDPAWEDVRIACMELALNRYLGGKGDG